MSSVAYWKIRQRLLRVPGRRVRSTSTASACSSATCRSTRRSWRRTASRSIAVMEADRRRRRRRRAAVRRELRRSARAASSRTHGRRLNIRTRAADRRPGGPRARCRSPERDGRTLRLADLGRVVEDHQPLWGEARRQRRPRPDADRPEVPRRQHDGGHARRRGRRSTRCARACRASRSTRRSSGPATFIEQSIDNLTEALLIGVAARDPDHRRVPVRVAHGVHQPDRDPAVAARRDPRARPARHDDQRDGPRRAGGRHRGGRRRRDHRRREHRAPPATGARRRASSVDVQGRARRLGRGPQRDHLRDDHQRRRDRARCSSSRGCRARSSSRWCCPTGWRCSCRCSSR